MNITLSADRDVVRRARDAARRQGKSLNQLVRDYMASLSEDPDGARAAADLFSLMDEGGGDSGGATWTRDDLHDR